MQKERLTFARVLIEVSLNHKKPTWILFADENGKIIEQEVFYDGSWYYVPHAITMGMRSRNVGNI